MYLPMGQKDYGPKENERMKEELPGRLNVVENVLAALILTSYQLRERMFLM